MLQSFKKILVPVDFTLNTDVAINKTLELVDDDHPVIDLLYVKKTGYVFKKDQHTDYDEKLKQWKETIEDYHPSVVVRICVKKSGSVQTAIMEKAEEVNADLIVIGQTATHYWLPVLKTVLPMRLAASTRIPVLTVKPGSLHGKIKTIVVPVTDKLSDIKIHALELLCRRNRRNIHLVTFADDKNVLPEISASAVLKTYQLLKAKLHCPVEYAVIHGANKARAILQYAEMKNADILLVYPKKETQLSWWNRHISDVLPADSKVQVLAVQPAVH
jgi:nucleotide-binding universal stress UspA family protein